MGTPEKRPVPDYEASLSASENDVMDSFARLMIVRALRPDRTPLAITAFVSIVTCMEESFVTDQISDSDASISFQDMCEEMSSNVPALCVSSRGSDGVTEMISKHAKKLRRTFVSKCVGESSSETNLADAIADAAAAGS